MTDHAISPYREYCDGFGSPGATGNGYLLGGMIGVGKAPLQFTSERTSLLDEITAFDTAEVEDVFLGQINMITVSSFCGLAGSIWGYDLARHPDIFKDDPLLSSMELTSNGAPVRIYSGVPLIDSLRSLFGTVNNKRFPLIPGAHVPCAGKSIKKKGPAHIFGGFAIGIPKDRSKNACLLMEDVGTIPTDFYESDMQMRRDILSNLARSIITIGDNQRVQYKEIFVAMKHIQIEKDEIGCVLVAAPYFTLAQNAIPQSGFHALQDMTLENWETTIKVEKN